MNKHSILAQEQFVFRSDFTTHKAIYKLINETLNALNNNSKTPVTDIKFLGIYLQDSINWSCHIEYIIPKLSSACYVMRSIKPIMPITTLKTVYYSHFNAIITYGLPFWGNSPHSTKIFKLQKRIVRIMMGYRSRVSCRSLFKRLEILPLMLQYILSLMLFVVKNKHLFILNSITFIIPSLIFMYTKGGYIIWVLGFLLISPHSLKIHLITLRNLKIV